MNNKVMPRYLKQHCGAKNKGWRKYKEQSFVTAKGDVYVFDSKKIRDTKNHFVPPRFTCGYCLKTMLSAFVVKHSNECRAVDAMEIAAARSAKKTKKKKREKREKREKRKQ